MAYIVLHNGVHEIQDFELDGFKELGYKEPTEEELATFQVNDIYGGLQGPPVARPLHSHLGHNIPAAETTLPKKTKEYKESGEDPIQFAKDQATTVHHPISESPLGPQQPTKAEAREAEKRGDRSR